MKSEPHPSLSVAAGFTLVEMIVTLAIVGILVSLAAPQLRDAMLNARMVGMVSDTMASVNIARSEAVKRNGTVALCPSVNGVDCAGTNWAVGWIIFHDANLNNVHDSTEDLIKAERALENTNPNALTVDRGGAAVGLISYGPSGAVGGAQPINFTFCDIRAGMPSGDGVNTARRVTINATGRPIQSRFTCTAP